MERCFSCIRQRPVHICGLFDQELAKLPVPVEGRTVKVQVFPQASDGLSVGEQVLDGADIAVVGAPPEERGAFLDGGSRVVENEVGAAVGYSLREILHTH